MAGQETRTMDLSIIQGLLDLQAPEPPPEPIRGQATVIRLDEYSAVTSMQQPAVAEIAEVAEAVQPAPEVVLPYREIPSASTTTGFIRTGDLIIANHFSLTNEMTIVEFSQPQLVSIYNRFVPLTYIKVHQVNIVQYNETALMSKLNEWRGSRFTDEELVELRKGVLLRIVNSIAGLRLDPAASLEGIWNHAKAFVTNTLTFSMSQLYRMTTRAMDDIFKCFKGESGVGVFTTRLRNGAELFASFGYFQVSGKALVCGVINNESIIRAKVQTLIKGAVDAQDVIFLVDNTLDTPGYEFQNVRQFYRNFLKPFILSTGSKVWEVPTGVIEELIFMKPALQLTATSIMAKRAEKASVVEHFVQRFKQETIRTCGAITIPLENDHTVTEVSMSEIMPLVETATAASAVRVEDVSMESLAEIMSNIPQITPVPPVPSMPAMPNPLQTAAERYVAGSRTVAVARSRRGRNNPATVNPFDVAALSQRIDELQNVPAETPARPNGFWATDVIVEHQQAQEALQQQANQPSSMEEALQRANQELLGQPTTIEDLTEEINTIRENAMEQLGISAERQGTIPAEEVANEIAAEVVANLEVLPQPSPEAVAELFQNTPVQLTDISFDDITNARPNRRRGPTSDRVQAFAMLLNSVTPEVSNPAPQPEPTVEIIHDGGLLQEMLNYEPQEPIVVDENFTSSTEDMDFIYGPQERFDPPAPPAPPAPVLTYQSFSEAIRQLFYGHEAQRVAVHQMTLEEAIEIEQGYRHEETTDGYDIEEHVSMTPEECTFEREAIENGIILFEDVDTGLVDVEEPPVVYDSIMDAIEAEDIDGAADANGTAEPQQSEEMDHTGQNSWSWTNDYIGSNDEEEDDYKY